MEIDRNEVEQGAAQDEDESVRSDDSSANARDQDDDNGQEEDDESAVGGEEEEHNPMHKVEELILKLENDEWEAHEMELTLVMLPHLLHRIEAFRRALRGNTRITVVSVEVGDLGLIGDEVVVVSPEDFEVLGQVFASLESLKEITIESWPSRTGFDNLTAAAAFVRQTTQIQSLHLTVYCRRVPQTELGFDARLYTETLRHLMALESLVLTGLSAEETGHITMALPSLSNLNSVLISASLVDIGTLDDEILQRLLRLATLRKLKLSKFALSERNLLTISECLSSHGSHVARMTLFSCQLPKKGCESLSASMKHNNKLVALHFLSCAPGGSFFHTLRESLSENTSLRSFGVTGDLSKQSAIDLVAAVRSNYSLRSVIFSEDSPANGIDASQGSVLRCIPRLNQAGRSYMIEDPVSAQRGLGVLMDVKEDLDCLFLHLLENPSLCTEMLRCVADRKRKLDAIVGQADDEEPSPTTKKCRSIESGETSLSE